MVARRPADQDEFMATLSHEDPHATQRGGIGGPNPPGTSSDSEGPWSARPAGDPDCNATAQAR